MSAHRIGVIFDQALRNADEHHFALLVVEFARSHGHQPSEPYEQDAYDPTSAEYMPELLDEEQRDAIDYLNHLIDLPPYTYYGNDGEAGAFGLWASVESLNSDMASVPSYMMHVNDHGNVTLYAVELKEIWSVV